MNIVRKFKAKDSIARESKLLNCPKETFAAIRRSRKSNAYQINKLNVGNNTYVGNQVQDGFYESVCSLKTCNPERLHKSQHNQESLDGYRHIIDLSKGGIRLEPITEIGAFNLLQGMKPNVPDYHYVTPNHYNYAGSSGWRFFCLLLNTLISDISNTSISEANMTQIKGRSLHSKVPCFYSPSKCLSPAHIHFGNSPAKVSMASIQVIMLSGRYRFEALVRHWSPYITGFCSLSINCANQLEDIPHILGICSALSPTRSKLTSTINADT